MRSLILPALTDRKFNRIRSNIAPPGGHHPTELGRFEPSLRAPEQLWWQHTAGAAAALDLCGKEGNLLPGCEADFVVLNPKATPLLARRTAQTETLAEWLFALIVLGDDRLVH